MRVLTLALLFLAPFANAQDDRIDLPVQEVSEAQYIAFGMYYCAYHERIVNKDYRRGTRIEKDATRTLLEGHPELDHNDANNVSHAIYKQVREDIAYQNVDPAVVKMCKSIIFVNGRVVVPPAD